MLLIKFIKNNIPFKKEILSLLEIIFNKELKRGLNAQKKLELYSVISGSCINRDLQSNIEKEIVVWQYWGQGFDKCPPLVEKCLESVRKWIGKKIIYLDDSNVGDYVEIPDFILNKKKSGIISPTHFSDILRVCLLQKYGGIWVDATVLMTGKPSEEILNADFFAFSVPKNSRYAKIHAFSTWFIVSKPYNEFISSIKDSLFLYWKNESFLIDYYTIHLISFNIIKKYAEINDIWNSVIKIDNIYPHLMLKILWEKFDEKKFETVKKMSSIHKLSYKGTSLRKNDTFNYILNSI